jgi:hypothetical protein
MPEVAYKAEKGLIRVNLKVKLGKIEAITISGDFFMYPEDKLWELENSLINVDLSRAELLTHIESFFSLNKVKTPGVKTEDFVTAILKAAEGSESI